MIRGRGRLRRTGLATPKLISPAGEAILARYREANRGTTQALRGALMAAARRARREQLSRRPRPRTMPTIPPMSDQNTRPITRAIQHWRTRWAQPSRFGARLSSQGRRSDAVYLLQRELQALPQQSTSHADQKRTSTCSASKGGGRLRSKAAMNWVGRRQALLAERQSRRPFTSRRHWCGESASVRVRYSPSCWTKHAPRLVVGADTAVRLS